MLAMLASTVSTTAPAEQKALLAADVAKVLARTHNNYLGGEKQLIQVASMELHSAEVDYRSGNCKSIVSTPRWHRTAAWADAHAER